MSQDLPDDRFPTESEIECTRCGEVFFHELTRCPNCGLSVYDPEEDEDDPELEVWGIDPTRDTLEEWLSMLTPAAAIFAGLFLAFVVSTVVFIAVRNIFDTFVLTWPGRGMLLLSVPIGTIVGGYAAAALNPNAPRRMGWWVGGLGIIAALVLAGVDRSLSTGNWVALDTIPIWLLTVLGGAFGGEFWRRQRRDEVVRQLFPDLPNEDLLYEDLLAKSGHDQERAERLIDHEKYYMPNATRRTLIESAIERWERDNR